MSAATIRAKYSIPESAKPQIAGFTRASISKIYAGAIRKQASAHGYPDRVVKLGNADVLARLDDHATKVADSIVTTVNRMLDTQLANMPSGLTDEQITERLQPFLNGVTAYNREVLIPFSSRTAQGMATKDFARENGIKSTWILDPADTDQTDVCEDVIALGEVDDETMQGYDFPAHQRCPHEFVVVSTDESSLPSADDLWLGEE